jgi:hypothetical protein
LKTDDGSCFTPYIGSIGRFEKKLAKLKVNNPNLELKDIVKNSQIRYKIANKKSKYNNLEITFNMVEKEISTFFKKIKFNDKNAHEKYVLYICKQLDEVNRKAKDISSKLLHLSSRIKNERNEFIKKNM